MTDIIIRLRQRSVSNRIGNIPINDRHLITCADIQRGPGDARRRRSSPGIEKGFVHAARRGYNAF